MIRLIVNDRVCELEVEPHETLADVLRNKLGLTGVRVSCGRGECGSCTVLVDGKPVPSCLMLARQTEGRRVTTIEGLATDNELHPLQKAFIDEHGMQCGFCTPGIILTATAFLRRKARPTPEEVAQALVGHICRCGGYPRIVKAVLKAAEYMAEGKANE